MVWVCLLAEGVGSYKNCCSFPVTVLLVKQSCVPGGHMIHTCLFCPFVLSDVFVLQFVPLV